MDPAVPDAPQITSLCSSCHVNAGLDCRARSHSAAHRENPHGGATHVGAYDLGDPVELYEHPVVRLALEVSAGAGKAVRAGREPHNAANPLEPRRG